jgi:hypothetical protein
LRAPYEDLDETNRRIGISIQTVRIRPRLGLLSQPVIEDY